MLHLTERTVDLVGERFDVALRAGELPDSTLMARRIGHGNYRVVASPAYLVQHGTPEHPSDLARHACLRYTKTGAAVRTTWSFGKGKRAIEAPVGGRFVSDDFVTLRMAAERGLGIARLPGLLVDDAIRAGRLVSLLEVHATDTTPLHLVYVGGRHLPPRTRAFLDFVEPRLVAALNHAVAGRAGVWRP
jgi:DNA-binding transcriptional LysR family regulator